MWWLLWNFYKLLFFLIDKVVLRIYSADKSKVNKKNSHEKWRQDILVYSFTELQCSDPFTPAIMNRFISKRDSKVACWLYSLHIYWLYCTLQSIRFNFMQPPSAQRHRSLWVRTKSGVLEHIKSLKCKLLSPRRSVTIQGADSRLPKNKLLPKSSESLYFLLNSLSYYCHYFVIVKIK